MRSTIRRKPFSLTRLLRYGWVALILLFTAACHYDMYDQPKQRPLSPNSFFADGRASRPPVAGAVIAGEVKSDEYLYTGLLDGEEGADMPFPITGEDLSRGREKFNVFCAPCHGATGYGNGMITQRGAVVAANLHDTRFTDPSLTSSRVGHFFNVMTNGYRYMYSYASRIEPADRWRIAAYIRALQLSQNAALEDVPASVRDQLTTLPVGERIETP